MANFALQPISALGSIEACTRAAFDTPILSAEQEQELARRFRVKNDLDAARKRVSRASSLIVPGA